MLYQNGIVVPFPRPKIDLQYMYFGHLPVVEIIFFYFRHHFYLNLPQEEAREHHCFRFMPNILH